MKIKLTKTIAKLGVTQQVARVILVKPFGVPAGVPSTSFGAKGDILVGTGVGTFLPLSVGVSGEVPIADPAEPTGWKWGSFPSPNNANLVNNSGLDRVAYDVVVRDSSGDNYFKTTTVVNDVGVIGVLLEDTVATTVGAVAVTPRGITINVQGNVTRGHFLGTSATAGRAADAGTVWSSGTFALALTGYSGGGAGQVTALLFPYGVTPVIADGWTPVSDAWTYASATTINVPSGAASLYSVGDRLKMDNSGLKYNYVVAVADTLLTVRGNGVANAAITSIYYSHQDTPLGFPQYFAYTPTGISATNVTHTGRFCIHGRKCSVDYIASFSGTITFTTHPTLPVPASASYNNLAAAAGYHPTSGVAGYMDAGTASMPYGLSANVAPSGTVATLLIASGAGTPISATSPITWTLNDKIYFHVDYEI